MYYEINVALNGQHFFATNSRSIQTLHKLKDVIAAFEAKFTSAEGYSISVTRWDNVGSILDISKL